MLIVNLQLAINLVGDSMVQIVQGSNKNARSKSGKVSHLFGTECIKSF